MDNKLTEYVLKHSKKRDKELKYDFMPSLLEIIERPAHMAGTIIIIGIFTLLVAAVVWACISKIDVVVMAGGNVQPVGNINIVQSYLSGTIKSINVSEGEYVKAGDVLIELDTEALDINENQLKNQKKIFEAQQEIYKKILNDEDISDINTDGYESEFKPYIQAIIDSDISYKNSLADLEMEKTNADLSLQMARLQLTSYQESGMVRQIQTQELVVQQYEVEIEQIDLKISDTKTQYSVQINSQLSQTNTQLEEINANLEQYSLSKEYQQITAPVSGYVNSISVNTIGETITSAQELVTIVPDDTPMEVLCYVENKDIANIELGMEAEIKLEAYPYNTYGTVKGTVKYISPSSFVSERLGSVYLVRVEIVDKNEAIDIISGLSGSVEIKIGTRTVMQYFLEPIMKGFGESLKEK